jgi:hypothetical protein
MLFDIRHEWPGDDFHTTRDGSQQRRTRHAGARTTTGPACRCTGSLAR